jgi:hypothetical protein
MHKSILYLHPDAVFGEDFMLMTVDGVTSITEWNDAKLGPKPTSAEINAVAMAAESASEWADYQALAKAKLERTGVTIERISEGVALGLTTWNADDVVVYMQYRRDLRSILKSPQPLKIPTELPAEPPYPSGT